MDEIEKSLNGEDLNSGVDDPEIVEMCYFLNKVVNLEQLMDQIKSSSSKWFMHV